MDYPPTSTSVNSPYHYLYLSTLSLVSRRTGVTIVVGYCLLTGLDEMGRRFCRHSWRSTGIPAFHTSTMLRVAVIAAITSPFTRTRSARKPGAIRPRSVKRKVDAGLEVAAANACSAARSQTTKAKGKRKLVLTVIIP